VVDSEAGKSGPPLASGSGSGSDSQRIQQPLVRGSSVSNKGMSMSTYASIVLAFAFLGITTISLLNRSQFHNGGGQGILNRIRNYNQPEEMSTVVITSTRNEHSTSHQFITSSFPDEGYEFYGRGFGENGIQSDKHAFYTLFRYPKPVRNGVFLEIGSLDGGKFSNTLFLENELGWTGVLLETSGLNYPTLMKSRPNSKVHKVQMVVCSPAGYTPVESRAESVEVGDRITNQKRKTLDDKLLNEVGVPQNVPCKPLADILEPIRITKLDFVSLDVRGSELIVLNAIDFRRVTIRSILLAMNTKCFDQNDNRPLSLRRNLCSDILKKNGFCMVYGGTNQLWVSGDLTRYCQPNVREGSPPTAVTQNHVDSNQMSNIPQEPIIAPSKPTAVAPKIETHDQQSEQRSTRHHPIIELPEGGRTLNLITYSNHGTAPEPKFCPLVRSAYCAGYTMWLLGQGDLVAPKKFIDVLRAKFARLHQFLQDRSLYGLGDDSILCFMDAHDALVVRSLHDFEKKIRTHLTHKNVSILFNREISHFGLNTGMYCGTVINVFRLLDEVMGTEYTNRPGLTDQQLIIDLAHRRAGEFSLDFDHNHTLLANNPADGYDPPLCPLDLLKQSEMEERINTRGIAGLPRGTLTKAFPYFVHFAGGMNKAMHSGCGQKSCPDTKARYYDVDAGIHKLCP